MFLMRVLGLLLIFIVVVFAFFLFKGATKIEKMILGENEEAGDE